MNKYYPEQSCALPKFDGVFDAYKLATQGCDVLFAEYPTRTAIAPQTHETDNVGVMIQGEMFLTMDGKSERFPKGSWCHVPKKKEYAATFEGDTAQIEFWFSENRP